MITNRDLAVMSAYTGYMFSSFNDLHEYTEEVMGQPIFSHKFADEEFMRQLHEKSNQEFLEIIEKLNKQANLNETQLIPVQDGLFKISADGVVYKLNEHEKYEFATIHHTLIKNIDYFIIRSSVNKKQERFYLHRLYAEAFVPNPENKERVIFKDGNSTNLLPNNLMWLTPSEHSTFIWQNSRKG